MSTFCLLSFVFLFVLFRVSLGYISYDCCFCRGPGRAITVSRGKDAKTFDSRRLSQRVARDAASSLRLLPPRHNEQSATKGSEKLGMGPRSFSVSFPKKISLRHLSFGTIEHTHFERAGAVAQIHSTHLRHQQPSADPFAAAAPWLSAPVFLYVTACLLRRVLKCTGEITTAIP